MASDEKEPRTILIPVDGSEHSERAFNWYVNHLHREGDQVGVVNIVEPPKVPASFMVMGPLVTPDEWHKQLKANVEKAKEIGENYKKMCDQAGIKCSSMLKAQKTAQGKRFVKWPKKRMHLVLSWDHGD